MTVTPSASAYVTIAVHEYSGAATSSVLNSASAGAIATDLNPATGTATAAAGELVFAAYAQGTRILGACTSRECSRPMPATDPIA